MQTNIYNNKNNYEFQTTGLASGHLYSLIEVYEIKV